MKGGRQRPPSRQGEGADAVHPMIWHLEQGGEFRPKWYLNGFPKAGLHLLELMISPVATAMPGCKWQADAWLGTFQYYAWTNRWQDTQEYLQKMARLTAGRYFKGHSGHRREIDEWMMYAGISHVFIYRDLRDVAVSQAHHILNYDGVRFQHPAPNAYKALGGFDEVLSAVITGLGAFPGVVDRWVLYAPWLDCEWTLALRYEDVLADPANAAKQMLEYGIERTLKPFNLNIRVSSSLFDKAVAEMAEMGGRTELSPTYRKGQPGEWRERFTDEHRALFKKSDPDGWLVRLGYEASSDW